LITKDGNTRWVEVNAVLITWEGRPATLGLLGDITERKRAEEAVRESEEKFRTLFNRTPDGVYRSTPAGRYLDVNPAMVKMYGYDSPEEMFALDIPRDIYFSPEEREARLREALQGKMSVFRQRRKDGSEIWVEGYGYDLHDEQGDTLIHQGILRDITERKRAEEEKAKLQDQLAQAQKMESVGRLAGGVAHDFNNMLSVILGHAELAMQGLEPSDPLYDDLREIAAAGKRSADLTRQLLAFARKQTIAPKVLDLNDTVVGMLKMLRRLIGEDIDLLWKPAANLWPVKLDPVQVNQVLANLLVNARDAIEDVGKVTIETENVAFDEAYCADHVGSVPGEYVMLAVSDSGRGMDRETLSRIFEPFFTTKGVGEGTGLGLATVYGIVKQNNGFINVYSEPGKGTIFKIYIPRPQPAGAVAGKTAVSAEVSTGTETVLLVEDEEAVLTLGAKLLEQLGYKVLAANGPNRALQLAEEYEGPIHLLMTDVVMPDMNGRDLRQRLISRRPGLKSLFMSGYTANVIAHHGILEEGILFLQKPFSRQALAAKLREALGNG